MNPETILSFMSKWHLSHKRIAASMGRDVSVPLLRRFLAGKDVIPEEALQRCEKWLRSLQGNPAYDAHYDTLKQSERDRQVVSMAVQEAAKATRVKADIKADGSTEYYIPAKSAEAVHAGEEVLKGVRYGHAS